MKHLVKAVKHLVKADISIENDIAKALSKDLDMTPRHVSMSGGGSTPYMIDVTLVGTNYDFEVLVWIEVFKGIIRVNGFFKPKYTGDVYNKYPHLLGNDYDTVVKSILKKDKESAE